MLDILAGIGFGIWALKKLDENENNNSNKEEIHKDTRTKYDFNGYDKNGYKYIYA